MIMEMVHGDDRVKREVKKIEDSIEREGDEGGRGEGHARSGRRFWRERGRVG